MPSVTSQLYLSYARLLDFPTEALIEAVKSGDIGAELITLHRSLGLDEPSLECSDPWSIEHSYISLFEIGTPQSIAPLYESAYDDSDGTSRRVILEDLVRFYEFFSLDLGERPSEQPDHLSVELEFMAVLAQMEAESATVSDVAWPFRLAQRDFLDRHLRAFVNSIGRRVVGEPFYGDLLVGLMAFLNSEERRLERLCGRAPPRSGQHPGAQVNEGNVTRRSPL